MVDMITRNRRRPSCVKVKIEVDFDGQATTKGENYGRR